MAVGVGAVGVGVGAIAIPLALIGGGIISALLLADDVEAMIDKVKALPQAILGDPNDLGGEDAEADLSEGLTAVDDELGETPFQAYTKVSVWRKSQRSEAFQNIHGVGSQDDPTLAKEWAQWVQDNPLPPLLQLNQGGGVGGGAAMGGCVYQVSIRITAARRAFSDKGNILTNPLGEIASWMGQAAGGDSYYTKPEDASGYIADPLLDLLAVRFPTDYTTPWRSSGTTTYQGAQIGLQIEDNMKEQTIKNL